MIISTVSVYVVSTIKLPKFLLNLLITVLSRTKNYMIIIYCQELNTATSVQIKHHIYFDILQV